MSGVDEDAAYWKSRAKAAWEREEQFGNQLLESWAKCRELQTRLAAVERALAYTSERGVSCGGQSVDAEGCFAGDLAARIRAALTPAQAGGRGDGMSGNGQLPYCDSECPPNGHTARCDQRYREMAQVPRVHFTRETLDT